MMFSSYEFVKLLTMPSYSLSLVFRPSLAL